MVGWQCAALFCLVLGSTRAETSEVRRPTKYPPAPKLEGDPRRLQWYSWRYKNPVCKNLAGWSDSGRLACFHYEANEWCTSTGKLGKGWKAAWGKIEDYASDGSSAYDACCACGGGTQAEGCIGSLGWWKDNEGKTCKQYEQNNWCTAAGDEGIDWVASWGSLADFANRGRKPQDACCACGRWQDSTCRDYPEGWVDIDDDTCAHYRKNRWCTTSGEAGSRWEDDWGAITDFSTGGVSALTACCVCGGGCYNDPQGWMDIYGVTCEQYAANEWCASNSSIGAGWKAAWGTIEQYGRDGRNAFTACCECGGGSTKSPTLADKPVCKDKVPGWRDKEGDDCQSYALHRWCTAEGTEGEGWPDEWGNIWDMANEGHSAFSACCGCGSGCSDADLDWLDTDGDTCAMYEARQYCTAEGALGPGWVQSWGGIADYAVGGKSALDVCCACGGGSNFEQPLTGRPSSSGSVEACTDRQNLWTDEKGQSCADYKTKQLCTQEGALARGADREALDVCCVCGGGCVDYPQGWLDSYSAGCSVYKEDEWCTAQGAKGRNWKADWGDMEGYTVGGYSAVTACCACGGGVSYKDYVAISTAEPEPVVGTIGLEVESPQLFLKDGPDKTAMENAVADTLAQALGILRSRIRARIVRFRRLSGGDVRRAGGSKQRRRKGERRGIGRRLQSIGTITVEYELTLPQGMDAETAVKQREELRTAVSAVTPESAQAILSEKVAGKYVVQVKSIAAAPEGGASATTLEAPDKLDLDVTGNSSNANAVVVVAVVGVVLFSCCLACLAGRIFYRSCQVESQKRELASSRIDRGSMDFASEARSEARSEVGIESAPSNPALAGSDTESRSSPFRTEDVAAASPMTEYASQEVYGVEEDSPAMAPRRSSRSGRASVRQQQSRIETLRV